MQYSVHLNLTALFVHIKQKFKICQFTAHCIGGCYASTMLVKQIVLNLLLAFVFLKDLKPTISTGVQKGTDNLKPPHRHAGVHSLQQVSWRRRALPALGFSIYHQIDLLVIPVNFEYLPVITGTVNGKNVLRFMSKYYI